jgi:uncharacterized protein (DUF1015 family)
MAASSIEDYKNKKIKIHENILESKFIDRLNMIEKQKANTGPIF